MTAESSQQTERCPKCSSPLYDGTDTMLFAHLALECDEVKL